ncbi:STAS domain-containing protein [Streptomyces sp. NPDC005805]|uniref:STAS domain-containing protein n=1 Tax=Streptomyces sp. NPDC005805 TaxID=3157068 RepID=UPI0033D211BD
MRAEDLLQTHTFWHRDTVDLHLNGELDLATAPLFEQATTAALNTHPRHLRLDLTELTFCDQTGLRALHRLARQAHAAHVTLHLTGTHPRMHRTLTQQHTPHPRTPPTQHFYRG